MGIKRIVGIVLIAAGVLGLLYGGFSFTKETHTAKLGPLELSVDEKERVNVPVWLSVGSVIAGVVLLAFGRK
jgi:multidrug transporter EmrE-like cation transporter